VAKTVSHVTGASKGVITIAKDRLRMQEKTMEGGRIASAVVTWGEKVIHVINVYAPNLNGSREVKEVLYRRFLETLRRTLRESTAPKIMIGDFNLIMNNILDVGRANPATYYPDIVVEKLEELLG